MKRRGKLWCLPSTVSANLPFAQSRWFGDLRIDSRTVFVVDAGGVVRYSEYVPVGGQEPAYASALAALKTVLG